MGTISRFEYLGMISENRKNVQLDQAIVIAQEAANVFPDENIFEKILGDMLFQQHRYAEAGEAYLGFLSKIGKDTLYIKHFDVFLQKYMHAVGEETAEEYVQKVIASLYAADYTNALKINLCKIVAPYVVIEELKLFENDRNFKQVTSFIRRKESTPELYIIYEKVLFSEHTEKNRRIDKFIVSSMEKNEQYRDALKLLLFVLQYDSDKVAVRTLFRICRKLEDYTEAEKYIRDHAEIKKSDNFNILYEFVFYFSKIGKYEERNDTLARMEKGAGESIPILRTLYNFYLQFGMFDKAGQIAEKISVLISKRKKQRDDRKNRKRRRSLY